MLIHHSVSSTRCPSKSSKTARLPHGESFGGDTTVTPICRNCSMEASTDGTRNPMRVAEVSVGFARARVNLEHDLFQFAGEVFGAAAMPMLGEGQTEQFIELH